MKPAPFDYHRPGTVAEAVALLTDLGDDAKILGGGQSLLPIMNMRLAEPAHLVDVSALQELRTYAEQDSAVVYGGAVTHQMLEDGLVPDACAGLLQQAASGIGYRAIRSRGTLGGSLAHADSSAEWPTVLTAVNARVRLRSVRGERELPLRGFFHGFFSTSMEADELITHVIVPRPDPAARWGLVKTNRKDGEFAESLAVATLKLQDGSISEPDIWLGAARDVPLRLTHVEHLVTDRSPDQLDMAEVREAVLDDLDLEWGELDGSARHRAQLHSVTVHRALQSTRRDELA